MLRVLDPEAKLLLELEDGNKPALFKNEAGDYQYVVVPLVVSFGAGAEMRQSLGTAVFFGMLGVTFFGLVFTPVFYVVSTGLSELRFRWRKPEVPPAPTFKPDQI